MATVILLPGMACRSWIWDDVSRDLGADHEIIPVDWPERLTPGFETPEDFSDWLVAAFARQSFPRRVIIGHSLGGLVALAAVSSGRIPAEAVILVESFLVAPPPFFRNMVAPSCPPDLRLRLETMLNAESARYSERSRTRLRTTDHAALLRNVSIPVTALYGDRGSADRDAVAGNLGWPEWIASKVPVEVVPNAGHFPMVENPPETTAILRRILAGM